MKAMFTIFDHVYKWDNKVVQEGGHPIVLNFENNDSVEVSIPQRNKASKFIIKKSDREGIDVEMELRPAKDFDGRVSKAFKELNDRLIGRTVTHIVNGEHLEGVKRSDYKEVLTAVEGKYKIEQGDPDYLEWFLTLIGRSPKIIEDEVQEDGR